MNFNHVQVILLFLAEKNGLPQEEFLSENELTGNFEWSIDMKSDLNQLYNYDADSLGLSIDVYDEAYSRSDLLAAQSALIVAAIRTMGLSGFFESIYEGLQKVVADERFQWPDLPNDFEIPEQYDIRFR